MTHDDRRPDVARGRERALLLALGANGAFLVVEVVGGFVFGSLALLADAAHMASDVAALGIAFMAQRLMERPPSDRFSYGWKRAEVVGALVNALLLAGASAWILVEAVRRMGDPPEVVGGGLLVVALLGFLVNVGSAAAISRRAGRSLNMRAVLVHLAMDAAGSVAAMAAGAAVFFADLEWADPAMSIGIAVLVLWSAWTLLRETLHVLLEGTPPGLEPTAVARSIEADPAVQDVHHLHLWTIASDMPALSAHVVLLDDVSLHEAQGHGDRLKTMLAERFGIAHATLELECHTCTAPHVEARL